MYKLITASYAFKERKIEWYLFGNIKGKPRIIRHLTEPPFKDYCFGTRTQAKIVQDLYENINIFQMDSNTVFADHNQKDEDVWKIEFPRPYMKDKARKEVEKDFNQLISEADVNYIDLILKDQQIFSSVKIDSDGTVVPISDFKIDIPMAFFDLETDDRLKNILQSKYKGFAKPDTCDILSYALNDPQTGEYFFDAARDEDDKKPFLLKLKKLLYKYIRLEAWNGKEFDYVMLKGVFKRYRIPFDLNRFYQLDSMKMHEMLNPKERKYLALDSIAKKYLDIAKVRHTDSFYKMYKNYITGVNKLLETYNLRDVEIMNALENKFGFGGVVMETAMGVGCLPSRYTYARKPSQTLIRRNSMMHYGKRYVWKSKSEIPERIKFMGATVQDPIMGRWKNVVAVDLASLYNLIIQTFNISPEQLRIFSDQEPLRYITVDDQGKELETPIPHYPHDYKRYDQDSIGRVTLQTVEVRRNHYKKIRNESEGDKYKLYDMKQQGEKAVLLSTYGGYGARGSTRGKEGAEVSGRKEFYDYYCADDVTRYAREIIEMAKVIVESMGYKIVYGDTDSIYISLGDGDFTVPQVKEIVKDMLININNKYKTWMTELGIDPKWQKIRMEAQGYYSPFIVFNKKKNYVAREIWNGENDKVHPEDEVEIYGKGLKPFKSTATDFHKRFLKDLYKQALLYEEPRKMYNYIKKNKEGIRDGTLDHELVFEKKISKPINEYKTYTADLRYAKTLIKDGKLQEMGAIYFKYGFMMDKNIQCIDEFQTTHASGKEYFINKHVNGDVDELMNILFAKWVMKDKKGKPLTKPRVLEDWKSVIYQTSLNDFF